MQRKNNKITTYTKFISFLHKYKYELLFIALLQHLFIGVFLSDMNFYSEIIWPINMFILGIASVGVFIEKGRWKSGIQKILFLIVLVLSLGITFFNKSQNYFLVLNITYVLFFSFIFLEVLRFLLKPSYINRDIISAAACGYFLLLEISTFLFQFFIYRAPTSFNGVDFSSTAEIFMDLVYFSSITITSIGFGDISPNAHNTKMLTAFFGIVGQFYSVVLFGILISKFNNRSKVEE